jgi:CBS domain-containing protein
MACDMARSARHCNAQRVQGGVHAVQPCRAADSPFGRKHGIFLFERGSRRMNIAQIIAARTTHDIIACDVATPVSTVVNTLATKRIGALPVLRDGKVVGIVSERDVIYRLAEHGGGCLDLPVERIMTSPAVTVEPATTVDEALSLMTRRRFRHFPVVEGGALIAFISIGDLVKHKMDEVQHEAEALRNYIQAV